MNLVRFQALDAAEAVESHFPAAGAFGHFCLPVQEAIQSGAVSPYLSSRSKRALDVIGALVGLLILTPLLVLAAIAIRATSPGPALFWQMRGGRNSVPFAIVKFRSMYLAAADDRSVPQVRKDDAPITPLGRLLRSTSLDEIPQLWNVLRGDMSLVGPRPHAVVHDSTFARLVSKYTQRFSAKPGITDLAQVSGSRGAVPNDDLIRARVYFDLKYIRHASLAMDLKILTATLVQLVAYRSVH